MAFPFVAPFDQWVQEVLKQREEDKLSGVYKNPYAVLSSGALVVKDNVEKNKEDRIATIKKLLSGQLPDSPKPYKGCIIANNISSLDLSYRTGNTAIGIDFDGRIIEVEGETDRRVSTPIIEGIEIDTDGANNTTKTARVTVRCFTLKQLEMFEMFFMKPGMNVLLEFGDSSILSGLVRKIENRSLNNQQLKVFRNGKELEIKTYKSTEEILLQKQNFDSFVQDFGDYFRSNIDGTIKYFGKIESSLGSYDLFAGKVLDYNFSINDDLTYTVSLEINQSNQISLAIPNNPKKKTSTANTPAIDKSQNYSERDQIIDSIILNFDFEKKILTRLLEQKHPEEKDWITNEFFNYNKVDVTQKDQIASADPYVSLRFILHILMNYITVTDGGNGVNENIFKFIVPKYFSSLEDKKEIEFIPVSSRKNIISTSKSIIFPTNELPIPIITENSKNNEISIDSKNRLDGKINGYDFHYSGKLYSKDPEAPLFDKIEDEERIGNALNIFIRYEDVVRMWKQELYRIDFLEKILDLINNNSLGLFQLVYANINENGSASIIDYKLCTNTGVTLKPVTTTNSYRFKIGPENSIVRNFSFNFELSNLVAGQTIFNTNKFVYKAIEENKNKNQSAEEIDKKITDIELPTNVYESLDTSTMANADGWYSINFIEYKTIKNRIKDVNEQSKQVSAGGQTQVQSGTISTTNKEVTTEEEDLSDLIQQKSVKFKIGNSDTDSKILIYQDDSFILQQIKLSEQIKNKKPTLSPIDINLTVDGFSGFRCGYCFNVDGIPEIYNQNGVFQITNVKHSISNEGWTTTIEAGYLARKFD